MCTLESGLENPVMHFIDQERLYAYFQTIFKTQLETK